VREHLHNTFTLELAAELEGGRVMYAGGNAALELLGGSAFSGGSFTGSAMAGSPAAMGVPGTDPGVARVSDPAAGTAAKLGNVQLSVGALLLLALAGLFVFNKAGFRFSITAG
jgi:hypothetical protein